MDFEVNESAIRKAVVTRKDSYKIEEDWLTPSGKPRASPVYFTTVRNSYLDKTRDIKALSEPELHQKAREQIEKWKEQEIRAQGCRFEEKGHCQRRELLDRAIQGSQGSH
jgi:hypothetical protein